MAAKRVGDDWGQDASRERVAVASWSRCEAALAGSPVTIAASDPEGRYAWLFNAAREFPADLVGKLDADVLPAEAAARLAAAKAAVLKDGEPGLLELQLEAERGPRWFQATIRPHFDRGQVVGTVATFIDVTESKVQEEHLRIVLKELAHRSKNLLAVIQGIARQTATGAKSTEEFLRRFNGRVFSLSRAHDVLTDADWRGARIFDLVRSQIALYAEDRLASVIIEGENAFLRPNAAQYVGLALHELTTNAMKYGALSRSDGMIVVRFERSPAGTPHFRFVWQEQSSANAREPSKRSFGMLMLTEVVPTSISGLAELTFAPEGIRYHLDVPTSQLLS